jgi:hypothetical protein
MCDQDSRQYITIPRIVRNNVNEFNCLLLVHVKPEALTHNRFRSTVYLLGFDKSVPDASSEALAISSNYPSYNQNPTCKKQVQDKSLIRDLYLFSIWN